MNYQYTELFLRPKYKIMNIFPRFDQFEHRHIGSLGSDLGIMLRTIGVASLDQLIEQTVPASIRRKDKMAIF